MSTPNNGPDATPDVDDDQSELTTPETDSDVAEGESGVERTPLEKARSEARNLRDRAKTAESRVEELSRALFTARVSATGSLSDATDLEYDAELVDNPEKLAEAIDALLASKPYLKARKVSGDVGQGGRGTDATPTDFSALLRADKL